MPNFCCYFFKKISNLLDINYFIQLFFFFSLYIFCRFCRYSLTRTRAILTHAERMTPELIQELCESPVRLRQYAKDQAKKFPPPPFALKSNARKRKATAELDMGRKCKMAKRYIYDMYSMREKDALDTSLYTSINLPLIGSTANTTMSTNNDDDKSNTTADPFNPCDLSSSTNDFDCIELNLSQLCALCKLTQSKVSEKVESTENDEPAEEYKVIEVTQVQYGDPPRAKPVFEVKWDTREITFESIEYIWDCTAFQRFVKKFVYTWKTDMEQLWNEMIAKVMAESLEPKLTDSEAIEQCKRFDYNNFLAHFLIMVRMRDVEEDPNSHDYKKIYQILMQDMKHLNYYIRRLDQLQKIKEFEDHINKVDQSKHRMHVENVVDLEMPPMNEFTYTNDVIPRDGIEIIKEPPMGCHCAEDGQCSDKSECCPKLWNEYAHFPYTSRGKRRVKQGAPIYECNKACKCSESCPNRVVQNGRKQNLCIFKTKDRGWGVRTEKLIAEGQYVCEYVGEIISYEETERRGKEYDAVGLTYLFDLDFNGKDNPYTVDAAKFGNVSRFINHSCNPNLGVWPVWTDCLDPNLHKLCLFTLRKIHKDEELTFDYVNSTKSESVQPDDEPEDEDESIGDDKITEISESSAVSTNGTDTQDEVVIKKELNDEILIKQEIEQEQCTANAPEAMAQIEECDLATDAKKEGFACKCGAPNCRKIIFC